jgi:hypothetical protein
MAEKKERIRMTSPKGVAKYPHLSEPDTRFKKDGEHSVKLLLDADDATTHKFIAELDQHVQAAVAEQSKDLKPAKAKTLETYYPYKDELDKDTGDPTGNVEIVFKSTASYKAKDGSIVNKSVALFDSKGQPIQRKVNVGGGSIIKVAFEPFGFYAASGNQAGISLRMEAVQIIELKE